MEISTFELLYKALTPDAGDPTVTALARRVIQGYFLTMTNLENEDYFYQLDFSVTLPAANLANPANRLLDSAIVFFDIGGDNTINQPKIVRQTGTNFYRSDQFLIPAGQTALFAVLPPFISFAPGTTVSSPLTNLNPQIEVRGYTSIRLPYKVVINGTITITLPGFPGTITIPRFEFVPQSTRPVKVLLTAEHRDTFLPNGFGSPTGTTTGDLDQTNIVLPIASGKALNEVPPEQPFSILINESSGKNLSRLEAIVRSLASLPASEGLGMLTALLGQVSSADQNLTALNGLFGQMELPVALSKAPLKK